MVIRETSVDEEVIHKKKENQGADSTWAPFEETNNGPYPLHAPSHEQVGWLREQEC